MAEEGVTKVKLHKQDNTGLVNAEGPANSLPEKKEDPDELGSEDFKKAADDAQVCCHHCLALREKLSFPRCPQVLFASFIMVK